MRPVNMGIGIVIVTDEPLAPSLIPQLALAGIGVETYLVFATGSYGVPSAVIKRFWSLSARVVWM